jgi:type I restriction enzyme S subunit
MFGDPTTNPMGWNKVKISSVVGGQVSNGFFAKREDYRDDGNVQVLGVANIVNRMYSNIEGLPKTSGTAADIAKYGVKYGDMLFCRSSLVATGIGKASIVSHETPSNVLFECHVIRLPLDMKKCVPEFMQVLSTTDYFRNQVISQSKTATMTTIGQDGILKTEIILPPLDLQKQFLIFVQQTDKSKFEIQKSLEKLETLKKALMQKYFG